MNIVKIKVTVEKTNYEGLYWISERKGESYLNISYAGIKKTSGKLAKNQIAMIDQVAKKMLCELIEKLK